jgi:hypothetical protein
MSIQITSSYRLGTYGEIEEFSQQIILKIDGVTRFADLQLQIEIVKEKLGIFTIAVAEATNGGKLLTQAKIIAKKELIRELNSLRDLVKVFAKGEVTYATEAGFTLRAKSVRSNLPFLKPMPEYVKRGTLSGTVKGEVRDMPKGATELAIKYSYDGWVTEHNGTYSSGKKFVLEGLEVKREVEVKMAFHGTFQRQSDYSDAIRIFVL